MSSSEQGFAPRAEATLAAYANGGRLPHAILIEGSSQTLEFALKLAAVAVCSGENLPKGSTKPCGLCRDCKKAVKSSHPDIIVYSGGERARSFHIDSVREIRKEAHIRPNEAACKVFILENAQNMTIQAQNALLKIMEDPPSNVIFILTCENKALLLETVLSRVSVIALDTARVDEAAQKGQTDVILDLILHGSELEALAAFSQYERDRTGMAALLRGIRDTAAFRATHNAAQTNAAERLRLLELIDIADEAMAALDRNASGLLLTTILTAKFR